MRNRRIIYLLDSFKFPSGGVAVAYKHVEILAESGFNPYIALPKKPEVDFYGSNAPMIIHGMNIEIKQGDIFVIPEGFSIYMNALKNSVSTKIMFCQNQYYMPFSSTGPFDIGEYPVDKILCSSKAVLSFFKNVYGLSNLSLIPYSIDPNYYVKNSSKKKQIAFMPRKLPAEAKFIEACFKRMYKKYADIPWISIDKMTTRQAADILGESEVFLSLGHRESFGLPPLEAMACGCLVAGFHGDGGREYMRPDNGWWAETGDWLSCVHGIAKALDLIEDGGLELEKIKNQMAITVGQYSPEKMKKALLNFWSAEVDRP